MNGQTIDEIGRDEIVTAVARAALLGARGNSGVILSQIVRGAAEELASRPGELVDPMLVSAAFARAADAAYASVRDPAEGTMLSAVRAMATPRRARPRAHGHAAARPRRRPADAGRAARRGARARARGRQGGGRARPRAARGAARGGRRRRRRLRPDGDHRRLSRGAARQPRRPSSSTRPPRSRCTSPSTSRRASATARTSPSPASGLDAGLVRARGWRRSATRCWSSATTARCASTSTPTSRSGAMAVFEGVGDVVARSTSPTCTSRSPTAARALAADGAARRRAARPAPSSRSRAARG